MAATCASLLKPSIEPLRRKTHLVIPAVLISAGLSLTVTLVESALNFSTFYYISLVSLESSILLASYKMYILYFANSVGCCGRTGVARRPKDSVHRIEGKINLTLKCKHLPRLEIKQWRQALLPGMTGGSESRVRHRGKTE